MILPGDGTLHYREGVLHMEGVSLHALAAQVGTPAYVYSRAGIEARIRALDEAFALTPHRIHYAVKANSNLAVLALCHNLGTGFDIVSGGELSRVLAAGGSADSVIFSGVGKSVEEIDFALKAGIGCFNVESAEELQRIAARAENLQKQAPISIRVNPDVDAQTHPYISTGLKQNKFGVTAAQSLKLYAEAAGHPWLDTVGIDCHIGSQISSSGPLLEALTRLLELVDQLAAGGIELQHIDLGGGMGVTYQDEEALDFAEYGSMVAQILGNRPQTILLEPGRSITANAGILLSRVEYTKPGEEPDAPNFAVVDAAMNDLIRPALYQAWHNILPVNEQSAAAPAQWDVVGPVCESGDFLAKARELAVQAGDLLVVASSGAYGMVQASNYNSRGRACEVMVDGANHKVVRRRETIEDQLRLERALTEDSGS
ncbi:MAG: diaminopimelate decarboxylase [Pseudomonadota bacterium]